MQDKTVSEAELLKEFATISLDFIENNWKVMSEEKPYTRLSYEKIANDTDKKLEALVSKAFKAGQAQALDWVEKEVEQLADLEHKQWQSWVSYISEYYQTLSVNTLIANWSKNYLTDYKNLPEEEKEKDRVWARKVIQLLKQRKELNDN